MEKITASIESIKAEGKNLKVWVKYSDGDAQGYLFSSDSTSDTIQLFVGNIIKSKEAIAMNAENLQSCIGSRVSISDDNADIVSVLSADSSTKELSLTQAPAVRDVSG